MRVRSVFFCPVYDQVREFPAVLDALLRDDLPCDQVLLVNNGSTDGSEDLVHRSGLPFIDIPRNRGLGQAFMAALDWAIERDFDVFGAIAANGKMLPEEMSRLLRPLYAEGYDCATGSRFLPGGASPHLPRFRRSTIPLVSHAAGALTGRLLTDATCGYRALRIEPLRRAGFDWHAPWLREYGFEFYVYAKFLLDPRLRCIEVPITMRYPADSRNYSKIPPVSGWWSMLKPWLVARYDGRGFNPPDGGRRGSPM